MRDKCGVRVGEEQVWEYVSVRRKCGSEGVCECGWVGVGGGIYKAYEHLCRNCVSLSTHSTLSLTGSYATALTLYKGPMGRGWGREEVR